MESSSARSKRRRLIVSSYVSPRRPDLPATFESLNDDTLTTVLEFVGNKSYRSFGGVNKHCKEVYLNTKGMTKETFLYGYAPLSVIRDRYDNSYSAQDLLSKGVVCYNRSDVLNWALHERNDELLEGICVLAAEEGRTDILNEVLNNLDDVCDKEDIFRVVDCAAAQNGKLEVMKWIETKGVYIWKEGCAREAAHYGQLHIIQWLIEEKGYQLDRDLYNSAICGGQLHVMKWLREQEVDWSDYSFRVAAKIGNLDFLQWLHDECCPWPEDDRYCMYEDEIELKVIHWCRANGYSNRLVWSEPRVIY